MWKKIIFSVMCAISVLNCPHLTRAEETAEVSDFRDQEVMPQVGSWLELLDKGEYEQSWKQAGAYLKMMVKKEQWEIQISTVRKLLGDFISRSLRDKRYLKALPGAPDGEYCLVIFDAVFSNKAAAVETVTVAKDEDGQWRLVGYFIK